MKARPTLENHCRVMQNQGHVQLPLATTPDGHSASKGGIAKLLAFKWASLVKQLGAISVNRAHLFILTGILGGNIGFVNIYEPNYAIERYVLWEALLCELPQQCPWSFIGDFNIVEARIDKSNTRGRIITH